MGKNKTIHLKPHHFLDIIKLYGSGQTSFVQNPHYGHGFSKVANLVIKNPEICIKSTKHSDDICKPCKFNNGKRCVDKLNDFIYSSKEEWNKIIDKRIFHYLSLKENEIIGATALCLLAKTKLSPKIIIDIWKERPNKETNKRIQNLLAGMEKYLKQHQVKNNS